ncbi:MAG: type II toxin-antitoxin system RelE/ParE family toxin [Spirulina sp.]
MVWQVRYTKTFYKELAKVPESSRKIIEAFVFGTSVQENPFGTGKLEKLVGSNDY